MSILSAPEEVRTFREGFKSRELNQKATHTPAPNAATRVCRSLVRNALRSIQRGSLEVSENGQTEMFGTVCRGELSARIHVRDPRFYSSVALGGSLGAAEAYLAGYWDTDDLTTTLRLFVCNSGAVGKINRGLAMIGAPVRKAINLLNRNTRAGSRRNIAAHYDLGNDFFEQFLDDTMAYSCGIFQERGSSLRDASVAKFDRVCQALHLGPSDHVIEIGTGWGGFAIHAAQHYGCRVTTTTISHQQFEYAKARVQRAGVQDRIELLLRDYRDLSGTYDKLVSIEMIEAVGHEYLPMFFAKCSELLASYGMMALQAITIPDQRYEAYRKSTDFIQKHIFPGGCLPSLGAICAAVRTGTDMRISHLQDLAPHYARTLAEWQQRFHDRAERIRSLGADEWFMRSWDYYFSYCEAGFTERQIGVSQILLSKPDCRAEPNLSYCS